MPSLELFLKVSMLVHLRIKSGDIPDEVKALKQVVGGPNGKGGSVFTVIGSIYTRERLRLPRRLRRLVQIGEIL